ncbi:hypothetical protein BTVI_64959 [Pitangus sulphuratus]|nr:hypothetical protein BTVI_64959 [Pitangus sulphuratus]
MALPDEPVPPGVPSCPLPGKICDVARGERPGSCCGMAMAGFRTSKYQLPEWHRRNARVYNQAYAVGEESERDRAESKHLTKHAAACAQRAQEHSKTTLAQRLQDIHFWRVELQKEVMELDAETNLLAAQKLRLQRTLDATEVPYGVVTDNLQCRERRQPPDLVIDEVERQLLKEADLIRNIRDLLKRTIIQATNQIRSNRIQKEFCELDWSDKVETYHIDDKCVNYSNDSTDIQSHPSSVKFEEKLVSEVEELTVFLEALKRKLMESEQCLKNLEETRMKLEKEIAVKANSIFIDREKCMTFRIRYPVDLEVASYKQ